MSGGTETSLLQTVIKGWKEVWEEAKQEAEMERLLDEQQSKMTQFGERNKESGNRVCDRATHHQNLALLLSCFYEWRFDAVTTACHRNNLAKVESKRQQLLQVQHMFRDFAAQLETQLKSSSQDSARGHQYRRTGKDKNAGGVSLPDIHSGRK